MAKGLEHLNDAQLEQYGNETFTGTSDEVQRIEAHLEDCSDCRSRLLVYQRAQFASRADSSMGNTPITSQSPSPDKSKDSFHSSYAADPYHLTHAPCTIPDGPSEDDLRNLAAGLVAPDMALAITQHVAQCARCAYILRALTEDFSDDLTPEDKASLSELESSSPEWQKKLLRKIMPSD